MNTLVDYAENNVEQSNPTEPNTRFPQVWTSVFSPYLLSNLSEWDYTSRNLDALICFIGDIASMSPPQTETFCQILKTTKIKLAIECGGLCSYLTSRHQPGTDTFAAESVAQEFLMISKLQEYGIIPDYLNFDDPYWRALYPDGDMLDNYEPYMTVHEATEQLIHVMKIWQSIYPDIQFNINPNFPNWGWKSGMAYFPYFGKKDARGDFFLCLEELVRQASKNNLTIFGILADSPIEYITGARFPLCNAGVETYHWWDRLLDLEKEVKLHGLHFGIHFNSQNQGIAGTDREYSMSTLTYISNYLSRGGAPSVFSLEAWWKPTEGGHPSVLVPETTDYTYTNLVNKVIRSVKEGVDYRNISIRS